MVIMFYVIKISNIVDDSFKSIFSKILEKVERRLIALISMRSRIFGSFLSLINKITILSVFKDLLGFYDQKIIILLSCFIIINTIKSLKSWPKHLYYYR